MNAAARLTGLTGLSRCSGSAVLAVGADNFAAVYGLTCGEVQYEVAVDVNFGGGYAYAGRTLFAADIAAFNLPAVAEGYVQHAVFVDKNIGYTYAVLPILAIFAVLALNLGKELLKGAAVAQVLRFCVGRFNCPEGFARVPRIGHAGGQTHCTATGDCRRQHSDCNFAFHIFLLLRGN